jgi:hypothetical protein
MMNESTEKEIGFSQKNIFIHHQGKAGEAVFCNLMFFNPVKKLWNALRVFKSEVPFVRVGHCIEKAQVSNMSVEGAVLDSA